MTTGSCLCGEVRWRVSGPIEQVKHCHCSMCRKLHGAPFATYGRVRAADFELETGADQCVEYASSPGDTRAFCRQCGSVVPTVGGEQVSLALGSLDDAADVHPEAHIFAASAAPWFPIEDELPQHATWPPDSPGPVIDRPALPPGEPGVLRGSCQCGGIAYVVREPLARMVSCHCGRCRKARAAAHTSNGFTSIDGVEFVRGEELLRSYKSPSARFFTQTFCSRCGSAMPRLDPGRGIAVIPLGSLDDAPPGGLQAHIFVASKAPWYEIPGNLPRHDEMPPPA